MKGDFGFNGFLDLGFLFIEDILDDVQKGSESIISSIYFQTFTVSPAINDMVDLRHNLLCNNFKVIFFLDAILFDFDMCFISPQDECFRCALCGKVTSFLLVVGVRYTKPFNK